MNKLFLFIALCMSIGGPAFAQSVSLDHVDGLISPGIVGSGNSIVFHIRFDASNTGGIKGFTNGFVIYSPNGAHWDALVGAPTGAVDPYYGTSQFVNYFSNDGLYEDTIGYGGFKLQPADGVDIPEGFNEIVFTITTRAYGSDAGKTLCLDSAFYRPGGSWKWSTIWQDPTGIVPPWDGPHCYGIDAATAVGESEEPNLPDRFALLQNSPNPFNPTTVIRFQMPHSSRYNLTVYNELGRVVRRLDGSAPAGDVEIPFDGSELASGVYFYRLQAGDFVASRKMVLLK